MTTPTLNWTAETRPQLSDAQLITLFLTLLPPHALPRYRLEERVRSWELSGEEAVRLHRISIDFEAQYEQLMQDLVDKLLTETRHLRNISAPMLNWEAETRPQYSDEELLGLFLTQIPFSTREEMEEWVNAWELSGEEAVRLRRISEDFENGYEEVMRGLVEDLLAVSHGASVEE